MRVICCPDKFRGSMTAAEAAAAMSAGVRDAIPTAEVVEMPLADGGEGTLAALVRALGGVRRDAIVIGPLGCPVGAAWALLGDGTAVVELASASGIELVAPGVRNPMRTTTFGTGELIGAACRHEPKPRRLIVALGGSATNDGGAGLLQALGARITDADGRSLARGGAALIGVTNVDLSEAFAILDGIELIAACDVDAVLCGADGASVRFGPQKGATAAEVAVLDDALRIWGAALGHAAGAISSSIFEHAGAGAAGGTGAALLALGARLVSGAALVLDATGFDDAVRGCDLVLTGEGRIDDGSATGKVVGEVARRAAGRPVHAFAGVIAGGESALRALGVRGVHGIGDGTSSADALSLGSTRLRHAVAEFCRRSAWRR